MSAVPQGSARQRREPLPRQPVVSSSESAVAGRHVSPSAQHLHFGSTRSRTTRHTSARNIGVALNAPSACRPRSSPRACAFNTRKPKAASPSHSANPPGPRYCGHLPAHCRNKGSSIAIASGDRTTERRRATSACRASHSARKTLASPSPARAWAGTCGDR